MLSPIRLLVAIAMVGALLAPVAVHADRPAQTAPAAAAAPTVDQLIMLRSIGFNEARILQELQPFDGRLAYPSDAADRLTAAGFSAGFVEAVGRMAPVETIGNAEIAAMLDEGLDAGAVLGRIAGAVTAFDTSLPAMLELQAGREVPVVVTKAMLGAPLDEEDLKQLASAGTPLEDQVALIDLVGHSVDLGEIATALALAEAGVPAEVLAAVRERAAPAVAEAPAEPVTPATDPVFAADDLERFTHVTGLFAMAYPREWFFSRVIDQGSTVYQATVQRPRDDRQVAVDTGMTGLTLRLWPRDRTLEGESPDPVGTVGSGLSRLYGHRLQDMEPTAEATALMIDGRPAAYRDYVARFGEREIAFRWYLIVGDDHMIGIMAHTPRDEFERRGEQLAALAEATTFAGTPFAERRPGAAYSSSELAQRYRESVVAIAVSDDRRTWRTVGSAFFVRSDGYLVTNHHVVWHPEERRTWRHFRVVWTSELDRDPEDAELLHYVRERSRVDAPVNTGEDLALLKVSGAHTYVAMPLSPLEKTSVGDPLITIGFPISERFDRRISTTVSSGVVTRFNRDIDDRIETVVTDARLAPGNSGGPAVSLVTGGVIGVNTLAADIRAATSRDRHERYAVGYNGIMPIDRAIEHYPHVTTVTAERDQRTDATDAFDLAHFAFDKGWRAGAIELARRAVDRAPASAASRHLLAKALLTPHPDRTDDDQVAGERELERAIRLDATFQEALYTKADFEIDREEYLEAIKAINSSLDIRESWIAYTKRARVYDAMGQSDDALRDLEQAKKLGGGTTVEPYLLAGEIHFARKDFDAGLTEFQAAVGISPKSVPARLGVGRHALLTERYLAALLAFDALLEEQPRNPDVLAAIAMAYGRQGNHDRSVGNFYEAINLFHAEQRVPPENVLREAAETAADKLLDRVRATPLYSAYLGHYYDSRHTLAGHRYLAAGVPDDAAVRRAHLARAIALKGNVQDDERTELEKQYQAVRNEKIELGDLRKMLDLRYTRRLIVRIIDNNPATFTLAGTTDADHNPDEARRKAIDELAREFGADITNAIYRKVREVETAPRPQEAAQRGAEADRNRPVALIGRWFREVGERRAEIELTNQRTYKITDIQGGQARVVSEGRWALESRDNAHFLALTYMHNQREVTSQLPLRVARQDDGERLFLTQNEQEQEYRRVP